MNKQQPSQDTDYLQIGSGCQRGLAVLYVAHQDYGGKAGKMAKALNATKQHRAKVVTYKDTYLRYGTDYFRPTDLELEELLRWADIVHLMEHIPANIARFGKPTVITYSGTYYRREHE